jgi:uncharacterized protein YfdQ (DUF2303 family)
MPELLDKSAVEAIDLLSRKAASEVVTVSVDKPRPGLPNHIPALLNRQSGALSGVAELFEKYRTFPEFRTGTAHVTTLESFTELVNRHKGDYSAIFGNADWQKPSLTAVIDYHATSEMDHQPDFLKHRIHYQFPLSEEWTAWMRINKEELSQTEFAEWIEDHIAECSSPGIDEIEAYREMFNTKIAYPNELMGLSRGLTIMADIRVKNAVTLQTGEGQINFEEAHKDTGGNAISVPGIFIIAVPPFFLGEIARVPVRLRYRLRGGAIVWSMMLFRPDKWITEQVRRDMERAASDTSLPLYLGSPES